MMTMKISAMLAVPLIFITTLLVKPSLIGTSMFVTVLIVEFLVIYMVSDYNDKN
ncbi:hypothetical protein [Limosilactobacillus reuteri]|uniref:hypothetical protein n=1 Tax=Limosilactobacillus reuteri TaxID=1598 RepID=UPI001E5F7510|nr:hypothetical protein [Limosilactobacillus reuteri]MCC4467064.1 hypothetical protein [Limosilactobacillus reuteri]MCC4473518.1 hypothetical protein [Limosilactobacillus reuteri]